MTLKEQIEEVNINKGMANELEKIADEFAVGFGEWLISRAAGEEGLKLKDDTLAKYKQEKGL